MDTSGSVKGQTLELLIFTVKSLLDTLDDNDYVHVARFPPPEKPDENESTGETSSSSSSSESLAIVECFQSLVQATTQNKRLFTQAMQGLVPEGMAQFHQALKYAFDTMDKFDRDVEAESGDERGACCADSAVKGGCNKVIMVLTDAITDYPTELLNEKNKDKDVKIFTYAMGFAAKEKEKMKVKAKCLFHDDIQLIFLCVKDFWLAKYTNSFFFLSV